MEIRVNVLTVCVLLSGVGATIFDHSASQSLNSSKNDVRGKTSPTAGLAGPYEQSGASNTSAAVRLLCLINTTSSRHDPNAWAVKFTWGRRCNLLVFASDDEDSSLPAVRTHVKNELAIKTKQSLKYVYERYRGKFDWVLRAEDSTYVIVENLRLFLSQYDPSNKLYMGCRLEIETKGSFMSSRGGYVISRAAVDALVEGVKRGIRCPQTGSGIEDIDMSLCLQRYGVEMVDTRDSEGRHRFLHYALGFTGLPNYLDDGGAWMSKHSYYPLGSAFNCCSDTLISNYYPHSSEDLYLFEYLLYKVGKSQMGAPHAAGSCQHAAVRTCQYGSGSTSLEDPLYLTSNTTVLLKLVVRDKRDGTHPQEAKIDLLPMPSDKVVPGVSEPSQMQRLEPKQSEKKSHYDPAGRVRLLCLVVVTEDHEEAIQVQNTWGARCTHLVFLSYKKDPKLRSVVLNTTRAADCEFGVVKEAFKFAYYHYLDRVDWVLKVHQHSYIVVDNLIPLLSQQDPTQKLYVGSRMKNSVRSYYVNSEAGYVLNREAVRAFVEEGLSFRKYCRQDDGGDEDIEMGECLHNVGVEMVDTRDSFGSHTFLPNFQSFTGLVEDISLGIQSYYPVPTGLDCCSQGLISINRGPVRIFEFEFLLYRLRNFGLNRSGL